MPEKIKNAIYETLIYLELFGLASLFKKRTD
jgi:hypothetical protein